MTPWKLLVVFGGVLAIAFAAVLVWAEGGQEQCDGYWDHTTPGEAVCRSWGVQPHIQQHPPTQTPAPNPEAGARVVEMRGDAGWQSFYCGEGQTVLSVAYNTGESKVSVYCGRP